ncbi:acyl-homoserine-lactone synthase [Aliagarivorans marinus]|uniref:acyl-homoserine-lactone synthase n=1 Tax=Aliagarivorans marinus TaxID=561965 RepID=UPI00047E1199|nr:acyl-homoserine-lactone synthase [Aliagarivorans marinus]
MHFWHGTATQLDHKNGGSYKALANYRYRVFVEKLGWDLDTPKGYERDQFDRQDTIYIVSEDGNNNINGCARLLPTTAPYLLKEIFPQLINNVPAPEQNDVWEVSRLSAFDLSSDSVTQNARVATELVKGTLKAASAHGAKHVVGATTLHIERLFRRIGLQCHRMGVPKIIDGYPLVALWVTIEGQNIT